MFQKWPPSTHNTCTHTHTLKKRQRVLCVSARERDKKTLPKIRPLCDKDSVISLEIKLEHQKELFLYFILQYVMYKNRILL